MLIRNVIVGTLIFLSLIAPDVILGHGLNLISSRLDLKTMAILYTFSFSLTFIKQRLFFISVLIVLQFMQMVQLNYWLYFGLPIQCDHISKIFSEIDEILLSGTSSYGRMWISWLTQFLSFILLFFASKIKNKLTYSKFWILSFFSLFIFPALLFIKGTNKYRVEDKNMTFHHTARSFSMWFNNLLFFKTIAIKYEPYKKIKINEGIPNLVFIMGESTTSRYLSLYGYKHKTTPFLDSLKDSKHFAYTKGISSSITTTTSLALFFNVIREPLNIEALQKKETNLFSIAKSQGYHTVCFMAQGCGPFYEVGVKDIDETIYCKTDEDLLSKLSTLNLKEKNFVVIHIRNIHSPYALFHTIQPSFQCEKNDPKDYLMAILYHDDWIEKAVSLIQNIFKTDVPIIFTSDHGELLGEDGLYGHGILHPLAADVPIWAISKSHPEIIQWVKSHSAISHYTLGCYLALLMGIKIENQNDDQKTHYIFGTNFLQNSYISWQEQKKSVIFQEAQGYDYESSSTVNIIRRRNNHQ